MSNYSFKNLALSFLLFWQFLTYLLDISERLFVCALSPLSLCYRHPTQASLKVTTKCSGSVVNCQTQSTTTGESASTLTGQTRPLLSMATWRSWAPWYTRLTSGPKKMFRRSGWHTVCIDIIVCLCICVCHCVPHVLVIMNHVIQMPVWQFNLTLALSFRFFLIQAFSSATWTLCFHTICMDVIVILCMCRSTPQTIWNGFLRWGWSIIITSLSLQPPWA